MYGDVSALRTTARALHDAASTARDNSLKLSQNGDGLQWSSTAASAARIALELALEGVQLAATQLEDAARHLEAHADRVEQVKADIAAAERWFNAGVKAARNGLDAVGDGVQAVGTGAQAVGRGAHAVGRGVADGLSDGVDSISSFARSLPSPGSVDWLSVSRSALPWN